MAIFLRRRRILTVAATLVAFLLLLAAKRERLIVLIRDIGYLTRPIWDVEIPKPNIIIPHYHSPNLVNTSKLCQLHGWSLRTADFKASGLKVIDGIIFSIELDLLEIRMRELWNVVDVFIVLEADRTFTGQPKPLFLKSNLERFDWAKDKLRHFVHSGLVEIPENETPFFNEIKMRQEMSSCIRNLAADGDLVIVSDADEIPRPETIQLFRTCEGYPDTVHLQMTNYVYSFEFHLRLYSNWKPQLLVYYLGSFRYQHGLGDSYHLLTDAGWHCSFCFRHLSDFVFKMNSYSHSDRLTDPSLTSLAAIQDKICKGEDIFDMYPEAYTFKELFASIGPIPKTQSVMFVPDYIVENSVKFKYLLPGGCLRT